MVTYNVFRERDISAIDPSHALRTLVAMETLNMAESSEESIRSLICCPVRNERSEDVIGEYLLNDNAYYTLFICLSCIYALRSQTVGFQMLLYKVCLL